MIIPIITLVIATLAAADCQADDCLRALRATQISGRLEAAQSFCATFTASPSATTIPSFAANHCEANADAAVAQRLSSACECISIATTTITASITSTLTTTSSTTGATEACARASRSSRAQRSTAPSAIPTIAASLAKQCLASVPLDKTAAIALVDALEPYLEWQSDAAYKADPPSTYFFPPHNIFTYLASIKSNLQNGKYANEYEFQEDLYQLFVRGHDGHFIYNPDALTKAFEFGRQRALVSISEDGTSLPVIKIYEDIIANGNGSVVTKINDIDAATYVADFAYTATFNQDPDTAYNTMFYEKAFEAAELGKGFFKSGGRVRFIYPGDNTTFTFANGSTITFENIAYVKSDLTGIIDGPSFYQKFCNPRRQSVLLDELLEQVVSDASVQEVQVPGYPSPVIMTNDTTVSGYYLNGTGFEDVAVISFLAFQSESPLEFQQIAQQFFANAVRDGKKKLVIDLSGNGGGYILQGYDLFRQLFPDIVQDGDSRWKENPAYLAIAEIFSEIAKSFNSTDPTSSSASVVNIAQTWFNYRYDLNTSNLPFSTFEDKFTPQVYKGDNFTSLMRWNLDDFLTTGDEFYGFGINITGYRSRVNFTQPFEAHNIIMLQDGFCASTCTLFAELMRTQAGVKSIVMGGRPKEGLIQSIGGVKGAQVLGFPNIYSYTRSALRNATPEQAAILNRYTNLPQLRSLSNSLNVRDQILPANVDDGLPAQFTYELADCRLYWTQPMITDVTEIWKAAADAAFNGKNCNAGRITHTKSDIATNEKNARRVNRARSPNRMIITEANQAWIAKYGRKVIL